MTEKVLQEIQQILPGLPLEVISQGAEAVVFGSNKHPYCDTPFLLNKDEFIIKYRPSKKYRHPKIDASITKSRTVGEVKFMTKLKKLGINSPSVILADFKRGLIWMDHVGSKLPSGEVSSLKNYLWHKEKTNTEECVNGDVEGIFKAVGKLVAELHMNDMIHGDLTSSNIILQDKVPYLIDFGLSSYSGLAEDKAVDLYVLERAIQSTHSDFAEKYNKWLLEGYGTYCDPKPFKRKHSEIISRLEDVRLRGRKRSMLG